MEKELTYEEARHILGLETAELSKAIRDEWKDKKYHGRDGADTQDQRKLSQEMGRRFFKIKTEFQNRKTIPESEVMKIIKGDFNEEVCELLEEENSNEKNIDPTGRCLSNKFGICRMCRRNIR